MAKLVEQNYKNRDTTTIQRELSAKQKQLEKANKTISSLYLDYKNGIIQEYDFKTIYNQEIEKRDALKENIEKLNKKISHQKVISDLEFKRVVKKVIDVKKWTKEKLSDVIESVEIDNDDNIYINYKYDILEMA